jgi:hypothetical protein
VWNCDSTPFIQVTWEATDPPIRQTVRDDGADEEPEVLPPPDEVVLELLELQPVIASAAAATPATAVSAADLFLSPTTGTPSGWGNYVVKLVSDPWN